jgi:hypothetical protein
MKRWFLLILFMIATTKLESVDFLTAVTDLAARGIKTAKITAPFN